MKLNLTKFQIFLISLVAAGIFILVYSPHFNAPFPLSGDEWHSLLMASELSSGTYNFHSTSTLELGFHVLIFGLGKIVNLVFAYKFLPAIWAVISALTLFFLAYWTTNKNFSISLLSMLFFGFLKSNVYILGPWFFLPLTFSIPFIFLYLFLFIRGLQKENKKLILASLLIMLFIIPIHAISVLFAVPLLIIYAFLYRSYVKKEPILFLTFILIPLIGLVFYCLISNSGFWHSFINLLNNLSFPQNEYIWSNRYIPFTDAYPFLGYLFALIGSLAIMLRKEKKFLPYVIWPGYLLLLFAISVIFNFTYLSPYLRNMYYFAISLPFLSAIGLYYSIKFFKARIDLHVDPEKAKKSIRVCIAMAIALIIIISIVSYYRAPSGPIPIKEMVITSNDYYDLSYISNLSGLTILAPFPVNVGANVLTGKNVLTDYYDNNSVSRFYHSQSCNVKDSIISDYNVSYVLSNKSIKCNYSLIRDKYSFIYNVSSIR